MWKARLKLCSAYLCRIWDGPVSIHAKLLIPGIFSGILSFIIPNTISKFWVAICPYVLSELFVPDVAFQRRALKLPCTLRGNSVNKATDNPSSSPGNFIHQAHTHLLKSFPFANFMDQMVSPHCENFLLLLKERSYNPKSANYSLNFSVIYYFKESHSGPQLLEQGILNLQGDLPTRIHSSLLDLTPGAHNLELPLHRPQTHRWPHHQYEHPVTQDPMEGWGLSQDRWAGVSTCSLTTSHIRLVNSWRHGTGALDRDHLSKNHYVLAGTLRVWQSDPQTQPSRSLQACLEKDITYFTYNSLVWFIFLSIWI